MTRVDLEKLDRIGRSEFYSPLVPSHIIEGYITTVVADAAAEIRALRQAVDGAAISLALNTPFGTKNAIAILRAVSGEVKP